MGEQDAIAVIGEGCALYCEQLGVEMGMYETLYARFGMLNYRIWRAARLARAGTHRPSGRPFVPR